MPERESQRERDRERETWNLKCMFWPKCRFMNYFGKIIYTNFVRGQTGPTGSGIGHTEFVIEILIGLFTVLL